VPIFEAGSCAVLKPKEFSLTVEAHEIFVKFYHEVEYQLATGSKFAGIRGFGSKAAEHALRLAGCLTFFEDSTFLFIDQTRMQNGVDLARYFLDEHLRISNIQALRAPLADAENLINWLKRKRLSKSTISYIMRNGPGKTRVAEEARKALDILAKHGLATKGDKPGEWEFKHV
ncbi:MAG: DUF3987 domain-containing protein, partial [Proteobacteria bacterium]